MSIFDNYEIYASPCPRAMVGRGIAVLFRKGLDIKIRSVVLDHEGELVVLDVNGSNGETFRLVAVYVPTGARQPKYFRSLEVFL